MTIALQKEKPIPAALELSKQRGIVRPKELEQAGIKRATLYHLLRTGQLRRNARGLYCLPDSEATEHITLAEVAKRVPNGIVSLVSALSFHELTTQLPEEVWLTVARGSWRPKLDFVALNLTYGTGPSFDFGIDRHEIDGVTVKVYNVAKTLADCFKHRQKCGIQVCLEALKEAWSSRKVNMTQLLEAARVCRVEKVMWPYLETLS